MSYQVLARKWRPANFTEMVGQDHVLRALINALDEDRLHHAYLFTGTRGVGKTTVARIFSKSLNCETGVTSKPCGECSACLEIAEGRFIDLIEVDAASRTKVEDTRELLENVQYAPTRGRYKVYLIDEVHMLSSHSFNALLKTLEEPPPHVKFLLATTDPQKLPMTILSRCLQFNLKRMSLPVIEQHLQYILQQEQLSFENHALKLLANGADGSMRDALSLLDQAIAYGAGELKADDVQAMLGGVSRDKILSILKALIEADAPALMAEIQALAELTPDFKNALADLLALLHQIAIAQFAPDAVDDNLVERETLQQLAEQMTAEDVQLFYQIGLLGRKDLPLAPDPRVGFEMALLRMLAFKPAAANPLVVSSLAPANTQQAATSQTLAAPKESLSASLAKTLEPQSQKLTAAAVVETPAALANTAAENRPPKNTQVAMPQATDHQNTQPVAHVEAQTVAAHGSITAFDNDWRGLIDASGIKGMIKQMAVNCILQSREGSFISLLLDQQFAQLHTSNLQLKLQDALSQFLNEKVKLDITMGQSETATPAQTQAQNKAEKQQLAEQLIDQDPMVQALKDNFNAQIVPNSVRPID